MYFLIGLYNATSVEAHNRCRKLLYYISWSNNRRNKWHA